MDRINGADTVDIGSGRRGFRDENLVAGVAGTEVTAAFLNGLQEEVLNVVTQAGLVPSDGDWTQLWQALQILGLAADGRSRRWMSVLSMTLSSAPGAPSVGDAYLIPTGASGIWAANVGKIAEYTGASWVYLTPPNGHGISLPDGRVFIRIGGSYVELLASETRSGLVKLATVALAIAGVDTTSAVTPAGLASTLSNIVPPRPNLCPNGGFENGIGNIAVTKSGSGTWPSSITTNSWGRSIVLTGTKTDGTYVIAWPKFVADAGATYTISGDAALIAASGMVRYQIAWLDAADTVLSISTGPSRSAGDYSDSNARRQAMAGVVTAPAGAVSAQLQCVFDVAGATYIGARLAKVEKGGLPATAYTPPTPTIQH
ncbi:hypothetical protein H4S14_004341, partial [Agrobacterium vitis]|nr:hypothetical protein [Agrobacterium vitis]MBE1440560.1 hypothetical protein [Agrobacterium vitis]